MKIATWNVNSLRARLPHVLRWIETAQPDVVLLQELKTPTDIIPRESLEDAGYNVYAIGQKTYNGVAILSKTPMEDVITSLPGDDGDQEARYIQAFTRGWCIASVYVPNGQSIGCPKFHYKIAFLERLSRHIQAMRATYPRMIIGGDFNVAPSDHDVYDPIAWQDQILCSDTERQALKRLLECGLIDGWRHHKPDEKGYTWWDYRAAGFRRDHGLRIDHLLVSEPQYLIDVGIDRAPRGWERPSDHTPMWCILQAS